MSRNKLSKRLLMLSAAITMMLCQSAFAAEEQVNAEVQAAAEAPVVQLNMDEAMARAFETNPAIKIAGYSKDAARGTLNAARAGRGITIKANASASRGGYDEVWYTKKQLLSNTERLGNTYSNSVTATMPLYTGGMLSGQIMSAKAGYKSALVGVQKSYNDMRSTVTNGYYTVLQADDNMVLPFFVISV